MEARKKEKSKVIHCVWFVFFSIYGFSWWVGIGSESFVVGTVVAEVVVAVVVVVVG